MNTILNSNIKDEFQNKIENEFKNEDGSTNFVLIICLISITVALIVIYYYYIKPKRD